MKLRWIMVSAAITAAMAGPVAAQSVAEFYKGSQVTMLIGSGAGGGYDTYSRVLARHMGHHIPGNPTVVPKNMPGGASIKAANYTYNVAPKDGSVFAAVFNTLPFAPVVGKKGPKFDIHKFAWIGSIGKHQNICATWHASKTKTLADAKARETIVSATGATGNAAVFPTIFNKALGTKFKVVLGYKASGARMAVTRGEADGICGMSYQTLLSSNPTWFSEKKINIIAQIGLKPHPDMKGVPMALDLIKNKADRDLMTFLMLPQEMGRPWPAKGAHCRPAGRLCRHHEGSKIPRRCPPHAAGGRADRAVGNDGAGQTACRDAEIDHRRSPEDSG